MFIRPEHIQDFLDVFQVCDSTFPIGTFNHSYGMENYLRKNKIKKASDFETWLETFLKSQFKYGEGLVISLVMDALQAGELEKVWEYDALLYVSSQAMETRKGTKMIAKQMLQLITILHEIPFLKVYENRIQEGLSYGNPGIVFASFASEKGLSKEEAIFLYGYSINSTMVQNAVRAIPLGQKDGQLILKRTFPLLNEIIKSIETLDVYYLGANVPGIELAQINHEHQVFRLFMS